MIEQKPPTPAANTHRVLALNCQPQASRRMAGVDPLSEGITGPGSFKRAPAPIFANVFVREANARLDAISELLKSLDASGGTRALKESSQAKLLNPLNMLETDLQPWHGQLRTVSKTLTYENECKVINLATFIQLFPNGKYREEKAVREAEWLMEQGLILDQLAIIWISRSLNAGVDARQAENTLLKIGASEGSLSSIASIVAALDSYSAFMNTNFTRASKHADISTPFENYVYSSRLLHYFINEANVAKSHKNPDGTAIPKKNQPPCPG